MLPRTTPKVWRSRAWSIIRLCIAAVALWVLLAENPARMARLQLDAMPPFQYIEEVRALRMQERYAEAIVIADAGLQAYADLPRDPMVASEIRQLELERQFTVEEQSSVLHKLRLAGMGAISGSGDSLEALLGAIAADMLIVGDIRDLIIQGGKLAVDGEADPVILALSGIGLATTVAPEVDWGPSLLKIARKLGAMSDKLGDSIVTMVKGGKRTEALKLAEDVGSLSRAASPAMAVRFLKHVDDPADIARMASFTGRNGARGAFALHVAGKDAARFAARGAEIGVDGERLMLKAASKGPAGVRWLDGPAGRALFKPHVLVGLTKGLWKGNVSKALEQGLLRLDAQIWWLMPLVAVWVLVEAAWLVWSWVRPSMHKAEEAVVPVASTTL